MFLILLGIHLLVGFISALLLIKEEHDKEYPGENFDERDAVCLIFFTCLGFITFISWIGPHIKSCVKAAIDYILSLVLKLLNKLLGDRNAGD